ncbi:MAG: AzlC family ABC transporter permease [Campylobacteraceae bacterium]
MSRYLQIFKITLPIFMGYIPLGITFGILAVSVNIPWYFVLFMSIFIYAGSAQFLAVVLFSSVATLVEIFIAIFLVNLRHFFYGLSMINEFKVLKGFMKKYAIFGLTDETFALLKTLHLPKQEKEKMFVIITFVNQMYWVIGSAIGAFLGANIKFDTKGIEFILTALFAVLAIELYRKNPAKKVLIASIFIGLFGIFVLPSKYMLILSLIFCAFTLFTCKSWIVK